MTGTVPHVILDTNTLLHFKRPDLLDWKTLLDAPAVNLVVTPALIDELEAQKAYRNRSRKLKERAHAAIMWLSKFIDHTEPQEICPGVKLVFVRDSPTIQFAEYRLSVAVPDDQRIASALQFKQESDVNVVFVTNDTGLRMKLPTRGLTAVAPPAEDRLPDELDDVEKEAVELRQRLERYESRFPSLRLTFNDWKSFSEIELMSPAVKPPEPSHMSGAGYDMKTQLERAAKYISEYARWRDSVRFYFPCDLIIENSGSAEATDVQIDLHLPGFVSGHSQDSLPKSPKPVRGLFDLPELFPVHVLPPRMRPPGKPYFTRDGGYVSFEIPSLVHNRNLVLHTFYLRFDASEGLCNFALPYRITCTDLIDPIEGKLHFKLPKEST